MALFNYFASENSSGKLLLYLFSLSSIEQNYTVIYNVQCATVIYNLTLHVLLFIRKYSHTWWYISGISVRCPVSTQWISLVHNSIKPSTIIRLMSRISNFVHAIECIFHVRYIFGHNWFGVQNALRLKLKKEQHARTFEMCDWFAIWRVRFAIYQQIGWMVNIMWQLTYTILTLNGFNI